MKLWKIVLYAVGMLAVASCGTYNTKPKIQITHVLAVTEQGDTLRLPINMIKPNVYYNIVSYPSYPRYYGNWYNEGYYRHRSEPIYVPKNKSSNNNNNNGEYTIEWGWFYEWLASLKKKEESFAGPRKCGSGCSG